MSNSEIKNRPVTTVYTGSKVKSSIAVVEEVEEETEEELM